MSIEDSLHKNPSYIRLPRIYTKRGRSVMPLSGAISIIELEALELETPVMIQITHVGNTIHIHFSEEKKGWNLATVFLTKEQATEIARSLSAFVRVLELAGEHK
jgi:hypothetical protein